jgi:hypothetical protein
MKNKLELQDIAGYLPWGLKCEILNYKCDYAGHKYGIIIGYYFYAGEPHYTFKIGSAGKDGSLIKPLLRLLSSLTKEQEEILMGLIQGSDLIKHHHISLLTRKDLPLDYIINKTHYCIIKKLLSWHFDINGLIEKGLAIDINTL